MGKRGRKSRTLTRLHDQQRTIQKSKSLDEILQLERLVQAEKEMVLEKSLSGSDVHALIKARNYVQEQSRSQEIPIKSMVVDPMDVQSSFGYKDKPFQLSYEMLRGMARVHVFNSIVKTRKAQVKSFCIPQSNKYSSTGFIIDKRNKWWKKDAEVKKLTKEEEKKVEYLTNFVLNCGNDSNFWRNDTMERFVGKIIDDSLSMDQACFEIQKDRLRRPVSFFATDAATYRIADTYNADVEGHEDVEEINGYKPFYVQLYQGKIVASFYPDELCFGVRNPSTDIRVNGYGRSELEDLVQLVTSILNADSYNSNFFKVGSSPQGIITYSGNINQNTINDFKQNWINMVAGVANAHRVPVINGDKINFIPTHVPNKDMEFGKFQEFLIKCGCAVYLIDPSEIGFPMSGNSEGTHGLGGDSTEEKIKYSRDKGLRPILKDLQQWYNKYIIWQLDPEFELRFVGDDDFENKETELEQDIKKVGSYMTLNEIRQKNNLDEIEGGDIVLNPIYSQSKMMSMQGNPESNDAVDNMQEEDSGNNPNPFMKSLQGDLERLLN